MVATDLVILSSLPPDEIVGGATVPLLGYVHLKDSSIVSALYHIRIYDDATNTLLLDYPPEGVFPFISTYCSKVQFQFTVTIPEHLEGKRTLRLEAYYPARLPKIDATAYVPAPAEKPIGGGLLLLIGILLLAAGGKRK